MESLTLEVRISFAVNTIDQCKFAMVAVGRSEAAVQSCLHTTELVKQIFVSLPSLLLVNRIDLVSYRDEASIDTRFSSEIVVFLPVEGRYST